MIGDWPSLIAGAAAEASKAAIGGPDNPVDVKITGSNWTPTGYAAWGIFVVIVGRIFGPIVMNLPALYNSWIARDGEIRGTKRKDKLSAEQRITDVEERLSRYAGALAFLANAVTTSTSALDSEDHDERARAKVTSLELVDMAVSTLGQDDPFVKALARITRANAAAHGDTPFPSGKAG